MSDTMIELKPCPFCGGETTLVDYGQEGDFEDWDVECVKCGILFIAPGKEEGWTTTKEEVAEAWNRRDRGRSDDPQHLYGGALSPSPVSRETTRREDVKWIDRD